MGKTTTVQTLARWLAADGGRARGLGHDVSEVAGCGAGLPRSGLFTTVDEDRTGSENLILLGRLAGVARRTPRDLWVEKSATGHAKTVPGGCAAASTLERVTIVTTHASAELRVVVRMRQPRLRSSEKAKDARNDRDDLRGDSPGRLRHRPL